MSEARSFYRIVSPGVTANGRLFLEIRYGASNGHGAPGRLSITGVEGPMRNGDCRGSAGQVADALDRIAVWNLAPEWTATAVRQLRGVWDRWHLNDMRAGTPAQEAWLRDHGDAFPGYPVSHYEWASEQLAAVGLNPDPAHEDTRAPRRTPTLDDAFPGYRYGSAWLHEDVPADVLDWLEALPETTHTYPWGES